MNLTPGIKKWTSTVQAKQLNFLFFKLQIITKLPEIVWNGWHLAFILNCTLRLLCILDVCVCVSDLFWDQLRKKAYMATMLTAHKFF